MCQMDRSFQHAWQQCLSTFGAHWCLTLAIAEHLSLGAAASGGI